MSDRGDRSGTYPSQPPPAPPSAPEALPCNARRGLAKCNPAKEERRRATAVWFRTWLAERRISRDDLHRQWGIPVATVQDMVNGYLPLHVEDIGAFPARWRNEYLFCLGVFWASLDGGAHPSTTLSVRRHG